VKAARVLSDCDRFECSLTPYVDGELDPGHAVDVESHMTTCSGCAEKVAMALALRQSLKRTASRAALPASLRDRISATMVREKARAAGADAIAVNTRPLDDDANPKLMRLRYAVALAAAAGVAFAMGIHRYRPTASAESEVTRASATA
jgi:anti-sigma factor RsiW